MKNNETRWRGARAAGAVLVAGMAMACVTGCGPGERDADATALPDATPAAAGQPGPVEPAPAEVGDTRTPEPVEAAGDTHAAPPKIHFESLTYDFGRVAETKSHSGQVHFTNAGGSTLVIDEIKASCGCTAVALEKREYAPGETGTIEIEFKPVAPGEQKKFINVMTNDVATPLVRITMKADVIGFLEIEPRMIEVGTLRFGQEHRTTATVSSPDPDFVIDRVSTSNPSVSAHVVANEGPTRTVEIVVDAGAPWGGLFSWLSVTITGRPTPDEAPITHTSRVRIQGEVFGDLRAVPNTIRFGAKPGEVFERSLVLRRADGVPFTVLDATVVAPQLPGSTVQTRRGSAGTWEISFTATAPERQAGYRGTVEVTTDVPGEERITIPVSGVVRNESRSIK